MGVSDLIVIWGTNPVNTQLDVMTHAARARKERGARIAAVDIYNNDTMKQADIKIILRPGTDGAFACGVMHVLFREGLADRAYLERYTDCPAELEAHLATRTPEWASSIWRRTDRGDRGLRPRGRADPAHLLPLRLRLYPQPQRCRADARGDVHSGGDQCPGSTRAVARSSTIMRFWRFDQSLIEGHDAIDPRVRCSISPRSDAS